MAWLWLTGVADNLRYVHDLIASTFTRNPFITNQLLLAPKINTLTFAVLIARNFLMFNLLSYALCFAQVHFLLIVLTSETAELYRLMLVTVEYCMLDGYEFQADFLKKVTYNIVT